MFRLALALTLSFAFSLSAVAQEKRAMAIVDLIEVPRLGSPRVSPDGSQILFTRSDADWDENGRTTHIYRIGADGGGEVRLTNGENGESSPRWSPDGNLVAFLARRGEDAFSQIYLLRNRGGEAYALTSHESSIQSFQFSPDGSHIYFLASEAMTAEEKKKEEMRDDVLAFDEDYKRRHLWRIPVAGGDAGRISGGDWSVIGFQLSSDGSRIAHSRSITPLIDNRDEGEVWIMDAEGSNALQPTEHGVS